MRDAIVFEFNGFTTIIYPNMNREADSRLKPSKMMTSHDADGQSRFAQHLRELVSLARENELLPAEDQSKSSS